MYGLPRRCASRNDKKEKGIPEGLHYEKIKERSAGL
jgi:hypothetical protein